MKKELIKIPIEISAHHIHLTQEDFKTLFKKTEPTFLRKLGQHHFAAKETVEIRNKDKSVKNVRLVAPFRDKTQVEISMTDAMNLGIRPTLRISGNLKNTPGAEIKGFKGKIKLKQGIIIAQRHLHLNPQEAKKFGLKHKDIISMLIKGKRAVIFDNIFVRINPQSNTCVHLDTDEGNAAGIFKKTAGYFIKMTN